MPNEHYYVMKVLYCTLIITIVLIQKVPCLEKRKKLQLQWIWLIYCMYLFLLKYSTWRKRFHKLFHFCKDIPSQSSKISCPRSQRLRGHSNFHIFKLLLFFVNTPKYLFSHDCSFKICEKPSKFSYSVCIVFSVSA